MGVLLGVWTPFSQKVSKSVRMAPKTSLFDPKQALFDPRNDRNVRNPAKSPGL